MKKGIYIFLCFLFIVLCFPVLVFADAQTYYTPSEPIWIGTNRTYKYYVRVEGDCRIVALGTSANSRTGKTWAVRKQGSSAQYYYGENLNNLNTAGTWVTTYTDSNGQVYDMAQFQTEYGWGVTIPDGIVLNIVDGSNQKNAYEYTFGNHAVAPVEPINWGLISEPSFQTRAAGTGKDQVLDSLDTIKWNPNFDTNNNDISEQHVQIRVNYGHYAADVEKLDILNKNKEDFDYDGNYTLGTYPASCGDTGISYSWASIVSHADWEASSDAKLLGIIFDTRTNGYVSRGWYYEIRLIADNYEGEWQRLYTPLSVSGKSNVAITNNQYVTNEVINAFNETLTVNNEINNTVNITTNQNYFNDTPVVTQDQNIDIPDYTDILTLLKDYLIKLVNQVLNLPEQLTNQFTNLITFNFVDELPENEELETEIGEKLENTYYGDLISALYSIKTTFDNNKNRIGTEDSGIIHIPELYFDWQGDKIVFLPATDFSLYEWVNSNPDLETWYLNYLNIMDGFIYILLIRTLFKRMISHLNGGEVQ